MNQRNHHLRSNLGGHYAGTGMEMPVSSDESYRNHSVLVRLPSDHIDHSSLSGPVTTYNLYSNVVQLLPDCEVCGQRMDKQFLQSWNERRVCAPCIGELTAEVTGDVYSVAGP